jgi:hypothetical protein
MTCKITAKIETLTARIAADTQTISELRAQLAAAGLVAEVTAGYVVTFKVGRADTRREVEGTVLGRAVVKDVDLVRCSVGEGLDTELFNVPVTQLLSIKAPGAAEAGEAELTSADPTGILDEVLG